MLLDEVGIEIASKTLVPLRESGDTLATAVRLALADAIRIGRDRSDDLKDTIGRRDVNISTAVLGTACDVVEAASGRERRRSTGVRFDRVGVSSAIEAAGIAEPNAERLAAGVSLAVAQTLGGGGNV